MGSSVGKNGEESGLTPEQEKRVLDLLRAKKKADANNISPTLIQSLWAPYLVESVGRTFVSSLSPDNKGLKFDRFVSLYVHTVLGHNEDKARALLRLLTLPEASAESVRKEVVVQYTEMLLQSSFKILNSRNDRAINSWKAIMCFDPSPDMTTLAGYICSDLGDKNATHVSVYDIESWLNSSTGFREINSFVLNACYNQLDEGNIMRIPNLVRGSVRNSLMSCSDFLFLTLSVQPNYRKEWRLLFSTRHHGESWTIFNKSIQRQGPTIIAVEDKNGSTFGGFASTSWKMTPKFYGDDSSFLFTLLPKMNLFESTGYNTNFQYLNSGQVTLPNGLGMGGQIGYWGLWINSEFDGGTVADSCTTFKDYQRLASKKEFKVRDIEVWAVGDADPTSEELGERRQGGPGGLDATTEALLEMAGKTLHGKVFREEVDEEDAPRPS